MTRDTIVEQLYTGKNFTDCINKMEPEHLREDLKQEVIVVVCSWPDAKIIQLHSDGVLDFYVARVIINHIQSNSSPFYKKYRQTFYELDKQTPGKAVFENDGDPNGDMMNTAFRDAATKRATSIHQHDEIDLHDRQTREALEDLALDNINSLYWYDAELLRLYMELGNYRAIQKKTGIPFISCYKNIQKSIGILRASVKSDPQPLFSKEETSFMQNNPNP